MAFLKLDNSIVNELWIKWVDTAKIEDLELTVYLEDDQGGQTIDTCTGFFAVELIWALKPGAFEGKRLKWRKGAWAFHNIVGHPGMQILAFLGLYKQAMWVHDKTVPKPMGKR